VRGFCGCPAAEGLYNESCTSLVIFYKVGFAMSARIELSEAFEEAFHILLLLCTRLLWIVGSVGMQQRPTVVAQRLLVQRALFLLLVASWHSLYVYKRAHLPILLVGVLSTNDFRTVLPIDVGTFSPKDILELLIACFHHNYSLVAGYSSWRYKSQIPIGGLGVTAKVAF